MSVVEVGIAIGNGDAICETVGVTVGTNDWVGTQGPLWVTVRGRNDFVGLR